MARTVHAPTSSWVMPVTRIAWDLGEHGWL